MIGEFEPEVTGIAASRLRQLREPALEALLRGHPSALRMIATACAQLALYNTELDQPPDELVVLRAQVEVAATLADSPIDAASRAARDAAIAATRRLDTKQLALIGRIDEETGGDGDLQVVHREYPAYLAAFRCFIAGSAVVAALDEDPFEGAVECAYLLITGIRIDPPTVFAIAQRQLSRPG